MVCAFAKGRYLEDQFIAIDEKNPDVDNRGLALTGQMEGNRLWKLLDGVLDCGMRS